MTERKLNNFFVIIISLLVAVKVRAKRNSFHTAIIAIIAVVKIAGVIFGRKIFLKIRNEDAPSTIAASSISLGTPFIKVVNTHTVKGILNIVYVKHNHNREVTPLTLRSKILK